MSRCGIHADAFGDACLEWHDQEVGVAAAPDSNQAASAVIRIWEAKGAEVVALIRVPSAVRCWLLSVFAFAFPRAEF